MAHKPYFTPRGFNVVFIYLFFFFYARPKHYAHDYQYLLDPFPLSILNELRVSVHSDTHTCNRNIYANAFMYIFAATECNLAAGMPFV